MHTYTRLCHFSRNYFLTASRWRPPRSGFFPVRESLNIINSIQNSIQKIKEGKKVSHIPDEAVWRNVELFLVEKERSVKKCTRGSSKGSTLPRIYGVPKVNKPQPVSLCPIAICQFFKVENNSLELTRIFKESFERPKVSVRRKCKSGEER